MILTPVQRDTLAWLELHPEERLTSTDDLRKRLGSRGVRFDTLTVLERRGWIIWEGAGYRLTEAGRQALAKGTTREKQA
jgi:DNA-binding PadR family transcriptional regulator